MSNGAHFSPYVFRKKGTKAPGNARRLSSLVGKSMATKRDTVMKDVHTYTVTFTTTPVFYKGCLRACLH